MKKNLIIVMLMVIGLSMGCKYLNSGTSNDVKETKTVSITDKTEPKEAYKNALENLKYAKHFQVESEVTDFDPIKYHPFYKQPKSKASFIAPDKYQGSAEYSDKGRIMEFETSYSDTIIIGDTEYLSFRLSLDKETNYSSKKVKDPNDFWSNIGSVSFPNSLAKATIADTKGLSFTGKVTIAGKETLNFKGDSVEIFIISDTNLPAAVYLKLNDGIGNITKKFIFKYDQIPTIEQPQTTDKLEK